MWKGSLPLSFACFSTRVLFPHPNATVLAQSGNGSTKMIQNGEGAKHKPSFCNTFQSTV